MGYGILTVAFKGKENKVRVTRMIIIVIVVFAVCWLPLQLLILLKAFNIYSLENEFVTFQIFLNCLAYGNSCMNPILYAFFSTNYRAAFWDIISCGKRRSNNANNFNGNANGHRSALEATLEQDNSAIIKSQKKIRKRDLTEDALELKPIVDKSHKVIFFFLNCFE